MDEKLINIIKTAVADEGFLFIDFHVRGQNKMKILEIFIDGKDRLTIDDCAKVSRRINENIDSLNLIPSAYRLDVSSPGVDRPLLFKDQYYKHINRTFEVIISASDGTEKKITAKLLEVKEDAIVLGSAKFEPVTVLFNDIKQAKVIVSFS